MTVMAMKSVCELEGDARKAQTERLSVIAAVVLLLLAAPLVSAGSPLEIVDHFAGKSNGDYDPDGRVFRIDVDLTGDGEPELLLAHSFGSGTGGQPWHVYSPAVGGWRYLGVMFCKHAGFGIDEETGLLVAYQHMSAESGGVVELSVTPNGIIEVSHSRLLTVGDEELTRAFDVIRRWQDAKRPVAVVVDYQELRKTLRPQWMDVNTWKPAPEELTTTLREVAGTVVE